MTIIGMAQKMISTNFKLWNLVFSFVANIHLFFCLNAYGDEKEIKNPIYVNPPWINIIVIPLIKIGEQNEVIDRFNNDFFNGLIKTTKYNFKIFRPDEDKLQEIMDKGFVHRQEPNDNSLIKISPSVDFWKDKDIDYIFYNAYKVLPEDVILEFRVYSNIKNRLQIGKRYTFHADEISIVKNDATKLFMDLVSYEIPKIRMPDVGGSKQ